MARLAVLGGTGYTGGHIVAKAVRAGHHVTSYSRTAPSEPVDEVTYRTGSLTDAAIREHAGAGAVVVMGALAPGGVLEDSRAGVSRVGAGRAAAGGVRFGVVGGFSALRPAEGAPRFYESGELPPEFAAEARTMGAVLDWLLSDAPQGLDWFYVSPAANYGSYVPGEELGRYRIGGEVALFDAEGKSAISGPDFAAAIVAEIDTPTHRRAQFSVAY